MYLRQPGFTYSACRLFTLKKEKLQTFKETGDSWYIYQNQLESLFLTWHGVFGDFKDLPRKTVSEKVLCEKAFSIQNMMDCFASLVYKFFGKKSSGANTSGGAVTYARSETITMQDKSAIDCEIMQNQHPLDLAHVVKVSDCVQQLQQKLHKPWLLYQKNLFIDKLDDIVNKYNNIYHRKIKIQVYILL